MHLGSFSKRSYSAGLEQCSLPVCTEWASGLCWSTSATLTRHSRSGLTSRVSRAAGLRLIVRPGHAAAIYRETGDRHREGSALNNPGNALRAVRRFDEAITAHQDAAPSSGRPATGTARVSHSGISNGTGPHSGRHRTRL